MKTKLLIVDDESQIREILNEYLSNYFLVELAKDGKEAVEIATRWKPDLILMDLMMPEMDGISACKLIREQDHTRHIPVIMLTAANTSSDRINAYHLGADDYISKPFDVEELKVRLLSKLKRAQDFQNIMNDQISIGNLHLDDRKREITIAGESIDFSPVEYGIVKLLMNCVEQVVSREKIMKAVWEDESKSNRLIDAHITAVRKKFAKFDGEFQTVYGAGYRLKKEKAET